MNRIDEYLMNCCEMCGCDGLPTPISNTDKLLYHLAEQLAKIGNGTGGGTGGNDELKLLTAMTIAEDGVTQLLWTKTDAGEDFVWNELYVLIKAVQRSGSVSSIKIGKPHYNNIGELFVANSVPLIQTNSFGNTSKNIYYYFETVPVGSRRKTTMVESNGDFFNKNTLAVGMNVYSDGTVLMSPTGCKDMTAVFAYIANGLMTGDYIEIWYR